MKPKKTPKEVTMRDGRETAIAEPYTYTGNSRLDLERSLNSISLLIHTLIRLGDKDLDYRIAQGLALALEELADQTHNLWDREEVERLGVTDFILKERA
jgi:hypothetical protein